jgi:ubiquinone/menaquinone biosynthesis C-methylase UbiE
MVDSEFWRKYADDNTSLDNEEFCKFMLGLANSLHAEKILEVGCSTGNDLRLFNPKGQICGIDSSLYAVNKAQERFPHWEFKEGLSVNIPYEDASFDLVFTHKLLNYLNEQQIEKTVSELFRVSKKYIVNCELYSETEESKDDLTPRNILKRWLNYKVKIISNVDFHKEIDPEQARFTLIKKL